MPKYTKQTKDGMHKTKNKTKTNRDGANTATTDEGEQQP